MALAKKHLTAIESLISGDSVPEASKKSGIPVNTLEALKCGRRLPEFKFELDRQEMKLDEAIRALHKGNKRMCLEVVRNWLDVNKGKKGTDTVKRCLAILNALGKSGTSVEIGNLIINMSPAERLHEFNRFKKLADAHGLGVPEARRN